MAEVWLQQTERKAVPSLSDDDVVESTSKSEGKEEKEEKEEKAKRQEEPQEESRSAKTE